MRYCLVSVVCMPVGVIYLRKIYNADIFYCGFTSNFCVDFNFCPNRSTVTSA